MISQDLINKDVILQYISINKEHVHIILLLHIRIKNVISMVWHLSLLKTWHVIFLGTDATLYFLANKHSTWLKPTQK
jgi:hypothetical protein